MIDYSDISELRNHQQVCMELFRENPDAAIETMRAVNKVLGLQHMIGEVADVSLPVAVWNRLVTLATIGYLQVVLAELEDAFLRGDNQDDD